jgi:hypothetical protein
LLSEEQGAYRIHLLSCGFHGRGQVVEARFLPW